MRGFVFVLLGLLVDALPFITTWRSSVNTSISLPNIKAISEVTIEWGDNSPNETIAAGAEANLSHAFSALGDFTISMHGELQWYNADIKGDFAGLVDISSWGGFTVGNSPMEALFEGYSNLEVSAPSASQPVFLPGANLANMFAFTNLNSALLWDLINATSTKRMFASAVRLNKPITFSNSQGVTTTEGMFDSASDFNQQFTMRTDGVTDMSHMFENAIKFNQHVNHFNTSGVTTMDNMFCNATSFNQPITFSTPALTTARSMFLNATSFNQPFTMNPTNNLRSIDHMFENAIQFAQTITISSTLNVVNMTNTFLNTPVFYQDLASWDTPNVTKCDLFCDWCGIPLFIRCSPCPTMIRYSNGRTTVCFFGTRPPTTAPPSTLAPSASTNSTGAPTTMAPTTFPPSGDQGFDDISAGLQLVPLALNLIVISILS